MSYKFTFGVNDYFVPKRIIYRGKPYLLEGHMDTSRRAIQKFLRSPHRYSGSLYVTKSYKTDTKSGKPLLYVLYTRD
jgi:hypothetical protein